MATIPTIPTEAPGNFNTAALWNANILGGIGYLLAPVRFKAYASTTQSIASGSTAIFLALDTEIVDSDGGHSNVTNTSRYTAQTAGLYWVTGSVCIGPASGGNATGTRTAVLAVNGVGVTGSSIQLPASGSNGSSSITSTLVQLAVGDYVELGCWQNSGTTLTTLTSATNVFSTSLSLARISA